MPGLTNRRRAIQEGKDPYANGYMHGGIVHGKKGKKKKKSKPGGY
tara:strand:- start:519 stop:653 length:135 start_codon:yes stop_codon:yes gene_type:complete